MEVVIIDGFKFEKVKVIQNLLVESDRLAKTIKYINEKKIKGITLNSSHGYSLKNIDFVADIADVIEKIDIVDDDINLKGIELLYNLKKIFIGRDNMSPIDFSYLQQLESCNLSWHKRLVNLNSCKYLENLYIRKFDKNFELLIGLEKLKSLSLIQSKVFNLDFLMHFPLLEAIELSYIRSLLNVDGLKHCSSTLKKLEIDHCKRIDNYDVLGKLIELTWLNVTDSKELEDIYFLKKLKKLEHFAFVNTNVVNGDMSPGIGIKYVGFNNKKHYSHTNEEIHKLNGNDVAWNMLMKWKQK